MLTIFVLACTGSEPEDSASGILLEPPAPGEGFQMAMTSQAAPYSEAWDCAVYDIPVEEIQNVNQVHYVQNEGTHHMTISTTGFNSAGTIEPGVYDCNELYVESDIMEQAVMMFGNQGAGEGEMALPEGIAAQLPPTLLLIHELHYVNGSSEPVDLYSYVNAYTIRDSEVEGGIWGGSVRDEHINIPLDATEHTEWSRCAMNRDVDVLFLASHMHELGVKFEIAPFDGTEVGEVFYTNDDWHDPKIVQYDPPLVIPEGQGFQFSCTWGNTRGEDISYGLTAEDEMCNMSIVHTPFDMGALCEVVETSDGVLWAP